MLEEQTADPKATALEGVTSAGLALLQALIKAKRLGASDDEMAGVLEPLMDDFEGLFYGD